MTRSPLESFQALRGAMTRIAALDARFEEQLAPGEAAELIEAIDMRVDDALMAWAELEMQQDSLEDIEDLLRISFGGRA